MGTYRILVMLVINAGVAQAAFCLFSSFGCKSGWCPLDQQIWEEDCSCKQCVCADPCLEGANCNQLKKSPTCDPCIILDSTAPLPCPANTTCVSSPGNKQCVCASGFTGYSCEFVVDSPCSSYPCMNGGRCTPDGSSYNCTCSDGYVGKQCQRLNGTDPCKNCKSCVNGSPMAVLEDTQCVCNCTSNWQGKDCNEPLQSRNCDSNCGDCYYFDNDDVLNNDTLAADSPSMTRQMCRDILYSSPNEEEFWSVSGSRCFITKNDPRKTRTLNNMCKAKCGGDGSTECGTNKVAIVCNCPLTKDDKQCSSMPCGQIDKGFCVEQLKGYSCVCGPGRTGQNCERKIEICPPYGCASGSTCLEADDNSAARCICPKGASGDKCDKLDPCFTSPCKNGGQCVHANNTNGYNCTCFKAFYGPACDNFTACFSSPCINGGTCTDISDRVYNCSCAGGWKGDNCAEPDIVYRILQKIGGGLDNRDEVEKLMNDLLENPSMMKDIVPFVIGLLPPDNRTALSWDVEDMFLWITYEEKSLDLKKDLFAWNDVVLGNCFSLNHFNNTDRMLVTRAEGSQGGLKAALKLNSDEYAPWVETTAIMTFIHPNSETIFSESARYNCPPSTMATIQSLETHYKRLGGRYGKCVRSVKDVASYYYEGNYTTDGCFHSCYQDEMKKECGCMDSRYPMPEGEIACQLGNRTCVDSITARGDVATWADCKCPLPCLNSQFDSSFTVAPFVRSSNKCNVYSAAQRLNMSVCDDLKATPDHVIVNVQVPRMVMTLYEETPAWTFNRVIGNIGGLGGVICGINLITFFEFGFFFFVQLPMTMFFNRRF